MTIKQNDFIEIEYTGKIKEGNLVFDTTNETVAKENNIHQEGMKYGSVVICVGEHQVIKGLDNNLIGKEVEKSYTFELSPEEAFGKKNAKFIQLIPTQKFTKDNINPVPGLQVNIDGVIGTIKTVTGGRTLVDFNHPLSGKEIIYEVNVKKMITDDIEKLKNYIKLALNMDVNVKKDNGFTIELKNEIPKQIKDKLTEKIKKVLQTTKNIKFTLKK